MSVDIFDSLIEELSLDLVKAGEYFGEIDDQPAILTVLSAYPPGVIFKIRVNSNDEHELEIEESLFELVETKKINISVENGYGWLTVYDLSDFEAKDVFDLLGNFIQAIQEQSLSLSMGCAVCHRGDSGEIYYCEGKINRLCPDCLQEKERQQSKKNKKLLDVKASSIGFSLLGMMGFSVVWVIMWLLYDYMFVLYGADEIPVSDYVLVGGVLIAIAFLAVTIGLPLRRFSIQNKALLNVIASVLAVISFVLGEVVLEMIRVIIAMDSFCIITSIEYYFFAWKEQQPIFQVVKIGLVIGSIIGIYFIAKKNKVDLDI